MRIRGVTFSDEATRLALVDLHYGLSLQWDGWTWRLASNLALASLLGEAARIAYHNGICDEMDPSDYWMETGEVRPPDGFGPFPERDDETGPISVGDHVEHTRSSQRGTVIAIDTWRFGILRLDVKLDGSESQKSWPSDRVRRVP